jgi:hypothetical protein
MVDAEKERPRHGYHKQDETQENEPRPKKDGGDDRRCEDHDINKRILVGRHLDTQIGV